MHSRLRRQMNMPVRKTLLEILFPKARAEVLRLLFGSKARPRYVLEIVGDSGLALRTVQDELKLLLNVGLLLSRSDGFRRFFSANNAHPLSGEIKRIARASERLPLGKSWQTLRPSRARGRRRPRKWPAIRPFRGPRYEMLSKRRIKS